MMIMILNDFRIKFILNILKIKNEVTLKFKVRVVGSSSN